MFFFPHILHIIQKSPFKTWWKNAAQKSKISKREQTLIRWWNCSRNTTSFLLERNPWENEPRQSKIPSLLDDQRQLSEDLPCHPHFELSSLVCFHSVFGYSIWLNASAAPNPFPMGPPRKRWYDKVADALLGDEEHDISSPSSRYALICERCFTHNGLVKESLWEDARECLSCCIYILFWSFTQNSSVVIPLVITSIDLFVLNVKARAPILLHVLVFPLHQSRCHNPDVYPKVHLVVLTEQFTSGIILLHLINHPLAVQTLMHPLSIS